jgi:hypothetical protein
MDLTPPAIVPELDVSGQFVVADPDGYLLRFFRGLGQRAVRRG